MAFPATTKVWEESMDPYDVVDYKVDLNPLLSEDESIVSYTVEPLTESELYGLDIGTSAYASELNLGELTIWLSIASDHQADVVFANGITLPIEISIITNSAPARKRQRTVAVRVIQR